MVSIIIYPNNKRTVMFSVQYISKQSKEEAETVTGMCTLHWHVYIYTTGINNPLTELAHKTRSSPGQDYF